MSLSGFGNIHQSEALQGALPTTQNTPQQCPFGLYTEQLSGSAFTRPRHLNLKSWLYRIQPSVVQGDYQLYSKKSLHAVDALQAPNAYRWSPQPLPKKEIDFIDGLLPIAGNTFSTTFIYQCTQSMKNRYFCNREFGSITIAPGHIAVIPCGIQFRIEINETAAAGYLCENRASPLTLPQLGLIGANGLANPQHFIYPAAAYEKTSRPSQLICKYQQHLWIAESDHSPLNVVAWKGNYAPYSYDLSLFNTINTVSFDHPDPSIFTVLTSESPLPGSANLDFVIFPPRWMVAEHTFRPPYFHRNIMSELMGLIEGFYDAKPNGFTPGGISIHNAMTPHGPDSDAHRSASKMDLRPTKYEQTMAFMLESREPWSITQDALESKTRQADYTQCWQGLLPAQLT